MKGETIISAGTMVGSAFMGAFASRIVDKVNMLNIYAQVFLLILSTGISFFIVLLFLDCLEKKK